MQLPTPILIALLGLTAVPVSMSAQASGPASALVRPTPKSSWDADRKNPYSRLFKPAPQPSAQAPSVSPLPSAGGKPEIKCGMALIPIDPAIDPRMVVPPLPSSTKFTIRAIDPPTCR